MAKLFPPTIEGKLPAQADSLWIINFTPNPSVGSNSFEGMNLKISAISTGALIENLTTDKIDKIKNQASFDIVNIMDKLEIDQFYNIQLAYIDKDWETGYYSNVGIIKYIMAPIIDTYSINSDFTLNIPIVMQSATEFLYSYNFKISNSLENIYQSKEILYVDNNPDDLTKICSIPNILSVPVETYNLFFEFQTANGYKGNTNLNFNIRPAEDAAFGVFNLTFNAEKACNIINFIPNAGNNYEYQLVRIKSNGERDFLTGLISGEITYSDFNLEADEYSYEVWYNLNEQNGNITYSYCKSNQIFADFEDTYLSDNEHQLRIRFNPKMNSFKETVLENKIDTIGGQFPFFFRNGNTRYKEFPIGGLISYHMDNEELFFPMATTIEIMRSSTPSNSIKESFVRTTNLTGSNIAAERKFKRVVLEWLNNGKPKLFRSPTEGNFIIRLMNVSLSPEEQLGRMLHSFSATAYEIADYNLENLREYNCLYGDYSSLLEENMGMSINIADTKSNITFDGGEIS